MKTFLESYSMWSEGKPTCYWPPVDATAAGIVSEGSVHNNPVLIYETIKLFFHSLNFINNGELGKSGNVL